MLTLLLTLLAAYQSYAATADYYTAAVVELAAATYPNHTADEVMIANAVVYTGYMANASLSKVDIIVFPEGGLHGLPVVLPSPAEKANPCIDTSNTYHQALVLLSCAAQKFNMYLVVNAGEKYYNSTTNKTEYYNSNVAFDRNGTVIARYRKFNPYGEPVNKPALDLHTFDTDFGVTFGMFICFDIDFLEPGVALARNGVKHFVFPHCWISELPFLTAIQAQWGFAYSLDVVLLASGCNGPSHGGTGSGIYHGRRGALQYFQTNEHTSRLIVANVSKSFESKPNFLSPRNINDETTYNEPARNAPHGQRDVEVYLLDGPRDLEVQQTNSSLFLLRDYTDVYSTQTLFPTGYSSSVPAGSPWQNTSLDVTLTTDTTICQGIVCCDFKVKVTNSFNASHPGSPSRGDDFTRLHYRLAAFDGVRWYGGGVATGGVQLCAVIACVNESISTCGLRSDDPAASVATYGPLYKVGTVFESISILGSFSLNSTFVYPDILTTAKGDNFGALVSPDVFTYATATPRNGTVTAYLSLNSPIPNLVTAGIYVRQFDRDGERRTELPTSSDARPLPHAPFMLCALFLICFNCVFSWIS